MAQAFRLYGPAIGEQTAIVDTDVTGVTLQGAVELTPDDGNIEPFTLDSARLRALASQNKAYDLGAINKNDPIWKAIEDVEKRYESAPDDGSAFVRAAEILFQGAA